ncbi:hypothetical protein [Sporosarcina sp. FA9]|uniref:hypothetical protein n=1 Tax=Sporosarcina sp. FA9 TaxID=3413030 RepID=UPI003F65C933
MIIGYRVEYAWWKYPADKLAINKKYAKTHEKAKEIFQDIINKHFHKVRIVPIFNKRI